MLAPESARAKPLAIFAQFAESRSWPHSANTANIAKRSDGQGRRGRPTCGLGPDAAADPAVPVRLTDTVAGFIGEGPEKADALSTLAAARCTAAGRSDDAIRRLEEAMRVRGGEGALLGLGLPGDGAPPPRPSRRAHCWLDRLRQHQPKAPTRTGSGTSWRSAGCGARPRPSSSTTRCSPMTRSRGEPSGPGVAEGHGMDSGAAQGQR